jgi:hypothetical protein
MVPLNEIEARPGKRDSVARCEILDKSKNPPYVFALPRQPLPLTIYHPCLPRHLTHRPHSEAFSPICFALPSSHVSSLMSRKKEERKFSFAPKAELRDEFLTTLTDMRNAWVRLRF